MIDYDRRLADVASHERTRTWMKGPGQLRGTSVLSQKFVTKVAPTICSRATPSPVPPRLVRTPAAVHPLPQGARE